MQIFPRSLNKLPMMAGAGAVLGFPVVVFLVWYYFSPWFTQVGYRPPHCVPDQDSLCAEGSQPVPYSHRLHAGQLGIDCRYCHVGVERSPVAMVPPTQTCMNCHSVIKTDSKRLQAIRDSWATGKAVEWVQIHKLPDYAYFDHSVHVTGGVGCVECHGRVDQMDQVQQKKPLSMGWCLECHRDVKENKTASIHIRPADVEVTKMDWDGKKDPKAVYRRDQLNPPENCSGCHR